MGWILWILFIIPPFLFAVMLHEIAHGWAAERLGDPTARAQGRITLNPLKHVDPMMTIIVPLTLIIMGSPIVFGGAKPVPINPMYFQNPRKGMVIVAAAGPIANLLIAILCGAISIGMNAITPHNSATAILTMFLSACITINVVLAVFNLIPVPPLDGGRIAVGLLPKRLAYKISQLEPYGFIIIIALLYFGILDAILEPVVQRLVTLP